MIVFTIILSASCDRADTGKNKAETSDDSGFFAVRDKGSATASFFAFDTYMKITVYEDEDGPVGEAGLRKLCDEAQRLEKIFSTTDPEAEIYAFNHRSSENGRVSKETVELFELSKSVWEKTHGALDPTAYPLVKAWGFTTGEYRVPAGSELEGLLKKTGMDKMRGAGTELIAEEGFELDFGATAKGYLSNVLTAMLREMGAESAMLDLGGNIEVIGRKKDGSLWNIGIKDPFDASGIIGYVSVSDAAVVTSGGYERYFTDEAGNVYWHIIDPSTGYPAHSGLVSVTVVGEDAAMCDALSTAFFVMGEQAVREYCENAGGAEYILVGETGSVTVSEGLKDIFTAAESVSVVWDRAADDASQTAGKLKPREKNKLNRRLTKYVAGPYYPAWKLEQGKRLPD